MKPLETMYEQTRQRIVRLICSLGRDVDFAGSVPVPACPSWSVRGVLAHVCGVAADITSGNIGGAATDAWTAAQVDARRDRSITDVLQEWDVVGPALAASIDQFPSPYGPQIVADLTVHEHDLRGALAMPGARDAEAVVASTDFLVSVVAANGAEELGLVPIEVRSDDRTWTVPRSERAVVGVVDVAPFELFRAASGRRSAGQIRTFAWSVDPDPYLPIFACPPFRMRDVELVE